MSADLFAAFEDISQPPAQQTSSKPSSTQFSSTPFPFISPSGPLPENPGHRWGLPPSTSNQFQQSWQTTAQPSPTPNTRPISIGAGAFTSLQPTNNDDAEDEDGWGDFEVAPDTAPSSTTTRGASVTPIPVDFKQPTPAAISDRRPTRVMRAPTFDLISNNLVGLQQPSAQPSQPSTPSAPATTPSPSPRPPEPRAQTKAVNADPNVLFDADDFEDEQDGEESEDDFGEFETVSASTQSRLDLLSDVQSTAPPNANVAPKASESLLDLDLYGPSPKPARETTASFSQPRDAGRKPGSNKLKAFPERTLQQPSQNHSKPQTSQRSPNSFSHLPAQPAKPSASTGESTWDWDSVEPPKAIEPKTSTKKVSVPLSNDDTTGDSDAPWDWGLTDTKTETVDDLENSALPPINIPPPSILLSAFPQLFDQANEYLYKPVSGRPQSIKDRVLSDTKVYDFLRGYISLATVAARIIGGRKMRWHRDKFLSQSMSISAAGSKGMKLAGVDKTQTAREDREAADIVSNWKNQIGRLRSAVASANSIKKGGRKQLKIPDIADTMQVQTARDVPTAPKACVICGLKRNERVAKVDYEVDDSFGEWWVEHWGHIDCKRFWLQHENTLRQR